MATQIGILSIVISMSSLSITLMLSHMCDILKDVKKSIDRLRYQISLINDYGMFDHYETRDF